MDQEKSSVGYLIVHVTTARGAIPLEGAQVNIRGNELEFNEGRGDILTSIATDRDGNTERIVLTTPLKSNSLSPNLPSPFATYFLEVRLEGYGMQSFIAVPIFEGITAIQTVDLIPLSENGTNTPLRPSEERFFETAPPSL